MIAAYGRGYSYLKYTIEHLFLSNDEMVVENGGTAVAKA